MTYTHPTPDTLGRETCTFGPAPAPKALPEPRVIRLDPESYPGAAYDQTQTDDAIRDGDVLVIPGATVAVMCSAWPVYVHGPELSGMHALAADADVSCLGQTRWGRLFEGMPYVSPIQGGADYRASFALAARTAV